MAGVQRGDGEEPTSSRLEPSHNLSEENVATGASSTPNHDLNGSDTIRDDDHNQQTADQTNNSVDRPSHNASNGDPPDSKTNDGHIRPLNEIGGDELDGSGCLQDHQNVGAGKL